jgi:ferredoxin
MSIWLKKLIGIFFYPSQISWKVIAMKIRIDKDLCTVEGICGEICLEVFRLNEEKDTTEVIKKDFDEIDEECVVEAAENCPSDAIIIEE